MSVINKNAYNKKINDLYLECCSGITKMKTLQSKKFTIRLALQIHSLLKTNDIYQIQKQIINQPQPLLVKPIVQESKEIQTQQIYSCFLNNINISKSICNSEQDQSDNDESGNEYDSENEDPQLQNIIKKFDHFFGQKDREHCKQIQSLKKQINLLHQKLKEYQNKQEEYKKIYKQTLKNKYNNIQSENQIISLKTKIKKLQQQIGNKDMKEKIKNKMKDNKAPLKV